MVFNLRILGDDGTMGNTPEFEGLMIPGFLLPPMSLLNMYRFHPSKIFFKVSPSKIAVFKLFSPSFHVNLVGTVATLYSDQNLGCGVKWSSRMHQNAHQQLVGG